MKSAITLGVTGFSLIAVTYGMARFAWGVMLPDVQQAIPFSPKTAGALAASSFIAYCFAVLSSSAFDARFGSRWMAAIAALCAAAGLGILAAAQSPLMLAIGLFIAGLSPGLASPALAAAADQLSGTAQQARLNTVINAGTSGGIMLSVPALLYLPGGWRMACVLFCLLALSCLWPVLRYLPGRAEKACTPQPHWREIYLQRPLVRLMIIAFISGVASAAWWSFGPDVLRRHLHVDAHTTTLLWLVSGGAGILGALTGPVASRIGMQQVYRGAQLCMAAPLALLAFSGGYSGWFFPAVAMCGAGYVTLSGVLLVGGVSATPGSPASGAAAVFFCLAAGQVVGAMLYGLLAERAGDPIALTLFCLLAATMLFVTPSRQRQAPPLIKGDGRSY